MIHYTPHKLNIIKRYKASEDQGRESFTRRNFKYNSKSHLSLIQLKTLEFNQTRNINEESKTNLDSELSPENDMSPLSDSDQENMGVEPKKSPKLKKNISTSPKAKNNVRVDINFYKTSKKFSLMKKKAFKNFLRVRF